MFSLILTMKLSLTNPLNYPLAVLAGCIPLVIGVRVLQLPSAVMIPTTVAIATASAMVLKQQQPATLGLDNPALEREILTAKQQAESLAAKASELRTEASQLLTEVSQLELLSTVQYACDRATELPAKIDDFTRKLRGSDSLLSVTELEQQKRAAEARSQKTADGPAREQLQQLIQSLERNIQLAQQGQDAREAQVVNLSRVIFDSAGVLQSMQNQLRTANLSDAIALDELQNLSNELNLFQENVDLLVKRS
jgi:chromosome segregation ATPase